MSSLFDRNFEAQIRFSRFLDEAATLPSGLLAAIRDWTCLESQRRASELQESARLRHGDTCRTDGRTKCPVVGCQWPPRLVGLDAPPTARCQAGVSADPGCEDGGSHARPAARGDGARPVLSLASSDGRRFLCGICAGTQWGEFVLALGQILARRLDRHDADLPTHCASESEQECFLRTGISKYG